MKQHSVMAVFLAFAAALLLSACGGGDSDDVAGPNTAPRYPSVSGRWVGEWTIYGTDAAATLELRQTEDRVQGTLTIGQIVNDVAGTVSEFGVLQFEGEPPTGCVSYLSAAPHLGLEQLNTEMDGPVIRLSPSLGSPCGFDVPFIAEQGDLDLKKAP